MNRTKLPIRKRLENVPQFHVGVDAAVAEFTPDSFNEDEVLVEDYVSSDEESIVESFEESASSDESHLDDRDVHKKKKKNKRNRNGKLSVRNKNEDMLKPNSSRKLCFKYEPEVVPNKDENVDDLVNNHDSDSDSDGNGPKISKDSQTISGTSSQDSDSEGRFDNGDSGSGSDVSELFPDTTGRDFTPHVINVYPGEDLASKIMSLFHNGAKGICVLSANGIVSSVTIFQPGGVLTYEGLSGERTIKRLRLSKALTITETTSVHEACRRMAARRVDALLLTDSNALLCGILTDKDIAAVVEGVEKYWGGSTSGPNTFIETLQERIFKPSLSTILSESSKVVIVMPVDTVLMSLKKMLECQSSCAIMTVDEKPQGILTTKRNPSNGLHSTSTPLFLLFLEIKIGGYPKVQETFAIISGYCEQSDIHSP
ncbi:hypothetical protein AgCh_024984 [Apium graveolens]